MALTLVFTPKAQRVQRAQPAAQALPEITDSPRKSAQTVTGGSALQIQVFQLREQLVLQALLVPPDKQVKTDKRLTSVLMVTGLSMASTQASTPRVKSALPEQRVPQEILERPAALEILAQLVLQAIRESLRKSAVTVTGGSAHATQEFVRWELQVPREAQVQLAQPAAMDRHRTLVRTAIGSSKELTLAFKPKVLLAQLEPQAQPEMRALPRKSESTATGGSALLTRVSQLRVKRVQLARLEPPAVLEMTATRHTSALTAIGGHGTLSRMPTQTPEFRRAAKMERPAPLGPRANLEKTDKAQSSATTATGSSTTLTQAWLLQALHRR
jgi:hypothetical protein